MRILMLFFIFSSSAAFAFREEGTRGGGDDIGLEFQSKLSLALEDLKSMGDLYAQVKDLGLESLYSPGHARAITIEEAQTLSIDGKSQDCVATSDLSDFITRITRARWKEIVSISVKKAIALHEALVLREVERTGQYPISGPYLARLGIDSSALISGNPLPSTAIGKVLTIDCKLEKPLRVSAGDRIERIYLVFDGKKGIQDPAFIAVYNTDDGLPPLGDLTSEFLLDSDTPKNIQYRPGQGKNTGVDLLTFDFKALVLGAKGRGRMYMYAEPKRGYNVIRPVYDLQCKITDSPPEN